MVSYATIIRCFNSASRWANSRSLRASAVSNSLMRSCFLSFHHKNIAKTNTCLLRVFCKYQNNQTLYSFSRAAIRFWSTLLSVVDPAFILRICKAMSSTLSCSYRRECIIFYCVHLKSKIIRSTAKTKVNGEQERGLWHSRDHTCNITACKFLTRSSINLDNASLSYLIRSSTACVTLLASAPIDCSIDPSNNETTTTTTNQTTKNNL